MRQHRRVYELISRLCLYFFLGIIPFLGGCAAIPVTLVAEGADAGMGLATGNARSFTYPRAQVHTASLHALGVMDIVVTKDQEKGDEINVRGKTKYLKVFLTLTTVTPTLTKVSVKVKKDWLAKDSTVEAEILLQINRALRDRASTGHS